jgi:2-polyprenyl-6-methoxyphenol hydroxylase-like FAD-dependent oxidoreductase
VGEIGTAASADQTSRNPEAVDVLVIGAGPTGLTMASELTRHGLSCHIVDQEEDTPARQSRALAIQARTLEIFEGLGVANEVVSQGNKLRAINSYSEERRLARVTLGELQSAFPFLLILPQSETEAILDEHLQRFGISVERGTRLVGLAQDEDGVSATLERADGSKKEARSSWLVGCDGAHSAVRHSLGLGFEGSSDPELWVLADAELRTSLPNDELHVFFGDGVLFMAPIGGGLWRVGGNLPDERRSPDQEPPPEEVQALIDARVSKESALGEPQWLSYFHVHSRLASSFREGRVFLAGDAAHVHSPAGGQGMNTGLQDAHNLAWKLALVHRGEAHAALLDSYDAERRPVGRRVVRATNLLTRGLTLENPAARIVRNLALPRLTALEPVRKRIRGNLSQLSIGYRDSAMVEDGLVGVTMLPAWLRRQAGPKPGDRALDATLLLPNGTEAKRLSEVISGTRHNLLLLHGTAEWSPEIEQHLLNVAETIGCEYPEQVSVLLVLPEKKVPPSFRERGRLLLDPDRTLHRFYGAHTARLYLLRPDGYVAFRGDADSTNKLRDYLNVVFAEGGGSPAEGASLA